MNIKKEGRLELTHQFKMCITSMLTEIITKLIKSPCPHTLYLQYFLSILVKRKERVGEQTIIKLGLWILKRYQAHKQ